MEKVSDVLSHSELFYIWFFILIGFSLSLEKPIRTIDPLSNTVTEDLVVHTLITRHSHVNQLRNGSSEFILFYIFATNCPATNSPSTIQYEDGYSQCLYRDWQRPLVWFGLKRRTVLRRIEFVRFREEPRKWMAFLGTIWRAISNLSKEFILQRWARNLVSEHPHLRSAYLHSTPFTGVLCRRTSTASHRKACMVEASLRCSISSDFSFSS